MKSFLSDNTTCFSPSENVPFLQQQADACRHQLAHRVIFCLYHLFQFEKLEGIPDLGVIMEHAEGGAVRDDRLCLQQTLGEIPDPGPVIHLPSPERHLQPQQQVHIYGSPRMQYGCEIFICSSLHL